LVVMPRCGGHDVGMVELPTGTVTMVFSDIEGSTKLLSRLGTAYAEALTGQRKVRPDSDPSS
jgi:class 3 adenylate cyclase